MCETCGVTKDQYDAARATCPPHLHSASWYLDRGLNPADYGHLSLTADEVSVANDHIQRYHAAHPDRGLTREELAAEFAKRT